MPRLQTISRKGWIGKEQGDTDQQTERKTNKEFQRQNRMKGNSKEHLQVYSESSETIRQKPPASG